jgi:hypothetical protein
MAIFFQKKALKRYFLAVEFNAKTVLGPKKEKTCDALK